MKRTRTSQKISKINGSRVRTKYKPVLNKAGDRCFPSPTVESNRSGRLEGPRKNDPAAMNSPKHMRQRCRAMRLAPRTPPRTSMRTSPAAASRHTEPPSISWAILLLISLAVKTNKTLAGANVLLRPLECGASLSLRRFEAGLRLCVLPCPFQNADPGSWLRLPKRGDNHGIDSDAARSHVPRSARASLPSTSKSNGRCLDSPYVLLPQVRRGPNRPIFLGHFMCQTIKR